MIITVRAVQQKRRTLNPDKLIDAGYSVFV
jgi:hypothetical protein